MNNKYFFPIVFLLDVLSTIFLCAIYLCSCPGTAHAEEARARVLIEDNPYEDVPVEATQAPIDPWYGLTMPHGWAVDYSNGTDIRARGPAGCDLWIRLTPDRRRVLWVLHYFVRTDDGRIVQRSPVRELQLTERVADPQVVVMEPTGCPSLEECEVTYSLSVNWPFADPNALQAVETQLNWLTAAIQADAARLEAEAAEQADE